MIKIAFTYSIVTPESAEEGEHADHGFYGLGGWQFSFNDKETKDDIDKNPDLYRVPWQPGELKQAISEARDLGIHYDCGRWWRNESVMDCNGEAREVCLHVDGITPSTYKRISRLLSA